MAVMARESWTDERLDDFKENVNERFDRVDREFARMDSQMKEGFARVDGEIGKLRSEMKVEMKEMRGDIKELHGDMKAMQRVMVQAVIAICTVMVTGFVALLGIAAF